MSGPPRPLAAVMAVAARRPLAVGLIVGLLAAVGAGLALRLEPSAATEQFVGEGSDSAKATERLRETFGEDAVIILVKGDLARLVLTADLGRIIGLEGCVSGNKPDDVEARGGPQGPCAKLAETKPVKVVFGPGTFINESVRQISEQFGAQLQSKQREAQQAGEAARKLARGKGYSKERADQFAKQAAELVNAQFLRDTFQLALRYGIRDIPRVDDPDFVSQLVFDSTKPAGTPKARFAYLFPTKDAALIQVRLKPGLSESRRNEAIRLVRRAVAMPDWKLEGGGRYVVTGAPVVVEALTESISSSILVLLIAALVVMALTLAVVFRARLRLLPLGVALAATALTFGGLSLAGASLTMASIGVLPVLIGLAVDYAIQVQARIQERGRPLDRAVAATAADGAPTVAIAAAATAAGFLVLVLSPVPMVRGFGLLLVAGIALALFCALSLGVAALVGLTERTGRRPRWAGPFVAAGEILGDAWRGAGDIVRAERIGRALRRRGSLQAPPSFAVSATHALPRRAVAAVVDLAPPAGLAVLLATSGWSGFAVALATAVAVVLLLGVLPGATGWTPGKLLTGLRVVDRAGRPPGVAAGVVRALALVPDLGAAPRVARRSPWRQRLGDRWAGTLVVRRRRLGHADTGAPGPPPRPWAILTGGGLTALAPTRSPRTVLGIAAAVAVLGWGLDTQSEVESDIQKLVPQNQALTDLRELQTATGVGGQIDVLVRSGDLADPEVVGWMTTYQQGLLKRFGYSAKRGCGKAELCPAFSLPDLFRDPKSYDTKKEIETLLDAVPPYFSQGVIAPDRKSASLAFGIRLMPLERQQEVIDAMRDGLRDVPAGVTAEVGGLPVLAAEANDAIASTGRRALTLLAGLLAVALILLVALRSWQRALVPLIPIVLATGWSALLLFAFQVPLNPMSVTLGALVIAISTEFSVLLAERYRREREAGLAPSAALEATYRSTGAAVLASGATAIAGFAVLVFSDIRMLRDFGAVTVVDLAVSLLGVLVVLPSVLQLSERRKVVV